MNAADDGFHPGSFLEPLDGLIQISRAEKQVISRHFRGNQFSPLIKIPPKVGRFNRTAALVAAPARNRSRRVDRLSPLEICGFSIDDISLYSPLKFDFALQLIGFKI